MTRRGRRGTWLVGVLFGLLAGCSDPHPIVGTWQLSHGPRVTFESGGTVTSDEAGSVHWEGTWELRGEGRIKIEGERSKAFGGYKTFSLHKVTDTELVLKSVESDELTSGIRVTE